MHLFFLIQNLLLLIFCKEDLEYMTTLCSVLIFISIIIKINHILYVIKTIESKTYFFYSITNELFRRKQNTKIA